MPFAYADLLASYPEDVRDRVDRVARFALKLGIVIEPFQRLILSEVLSVRETLTLCPRGQGKSTLMAVVALYTLLRSPTSRIYAAAATRDQAKLLWDEACALARRNPAVAKRLVFRHNIIRTSEGGLFRCIASDQGGRAHGIVPSSTGETWLLVDELHAHVNDQTYVAMRTTLLKSPHARMAVISTAGVKKGDTLSQLRAGAHQLPRAAQEGGFTLYRGERFAALEWALPPDTRTVTAEEVKTVNPASWVTLDLLREQLEAPGLRLEAFLTYHANVPSSGDAGWLRSGQWDGLFEEGAAIPNGSSVWIGVDASIKWDTTAVVTLWPRPDGKAVAKLKLFEPKGDGSRLSLASIEAYVSDLAKSYTVLGVVYDPQYFEANAQNLSDAGLTVVEAIQAPGRQKSYAMRLWRGVTEHELVHDGDPALAAHVHAAAITHIDGDAFRFSKGRSGQPIDAVAALSFAWWAMREYGTGSREWYYNSNPVLEVV